MTPFLILPKKDICLWLKRLVKRRGACKIRPEPTMLDITHYTGIPRNTLKWLAFKPETANISPARQRLLSKVIAMVENGQLDFRVERLNTGWKNRVKRATLVENPRPRRSYQVSFQKGPPKLSIVGKPPPFIGIKSFKDVLLR